MMTRRTLSLAVRINGTVLVGLTLCMNTGCRVFTPIRRHFQKKPVVVMQTRDIIPPPYLVPKPKSQSQPIVKPVIKPAPKPESKPEPKPIVRTEPKPKPIPQPVIKPAPLPTVVTIPTLPKVKSRPPVVRVIEPAPAPLPKITKQASAALTYKVKKGDSLWKIGRAYGVSVAELAAANHMKIKDTLPIGRVLTLPPGAKFIPKAKRPKIKKRISRHHRKAVRIKRQAIPASGIHVVKKGESLWVISMRYNIPVGKLKALNHLTSDRIKPKQKLRLRADAPGGSAPAAKTMKSTIPLPTAGKEVELKTTASPTVPDISINVKTSEGTGNAVTPAATEKTGVGTEVPSFNLKKLPHFVVEGDTLKSIAKMYNSRVEWIKQANPKIKTDADLKLGMKVEVPTLDSE